MKKIGSRRRNEKSQRLAYSSAHSLRTDIILKTAFSDPGTLKINLPGKKCWHHNTP